jgi:signal transduction histidine kinase
MSPNQRTFALLDPTGGLILEVDGLDHRVNVGQRLRLTGAGTITRSGHVFRIGMDGLVVDNDGLHPPLERADAVFLEAGSIPIQVEWFNRTGASELKIGLEGPDLTRRSIDDSELFRSAGKSTNRIHGLEYRCYEGWWTELPDFNSLKPVKTGTVAGFDVNARTREEGAGLQFAGFLKVPRSGLYKFYLESDDGSRLSVGSPNMQVEILGESELPAPRPISMGQILAETEEGMWGRIEGKVTRVWSEENGLRMELSVGPIRMEARVTEAGALRGSALENGIVQVTGYCQAAYSADGLKVPNLLLVPNHRLIEIVAPLADADQNRSGLPVLTTAVAVHQLNREEAKLGRPAKVRGVVTSTDFGFSGFTLQDSTGGLYVQGADPVRIGDYVEVEGETDPGSFAPLLRSRRMIRLGTGRLLEPIHPTWDQLTNGSLDAQYVDIEGIVTTVATEGLQLLIQGGVVKTTLQNGLTPEEMKRFANTLVRIRGVLLANWNPRTHQVKLGEIRIFNPRVTAQNPPPADVFATPSKAPADLLLFDPQASLFHRIKMSGQIVHVGEEVCFMLSGTNGIRFIANKREALSAGDTVDVAGYPQLGGASPLLHEAVIRKTGHAALPDPTRLAPGYLSSAEYDATRVRVDGLLTGAREAGAETVLEMQEGAQSFAARLTGANKLLQSVTIGSRLELTGVYAVRAANHSLDLHIGAFDLLLDSPADLKVLARPPWWTLRRLLVMLGTLACILVISVLWITQLHRKVEERTVQLKEQIQKSEKIEQHRAMEQERARIAQDLHDELGSGLTEISMLAAIPAAAADSNQHLNQIGDRARHMVTALDEIVWAMNPKHDSLESLGSYLCLYADRFLKLANITCRLKGTLDLPGQPLNPIHRHEFFLAFKEALTNVVRHSGATEVRLNIRIIGSRLRLSLADNGGGLGSAHPTHGMDGLANMRARLEKMGGRFAVASQAGRGTTLRFYLPLN